MTNFNVQITSKKYLPFLSLKREAGSNLVGSLVQVLGVKRCTKAQSDTRAKENIVCQGSNTTVVDLGLCAFP